MSEIKDEPTRHYMEPMDRLAAIALESPVIKENRQSQGTHRVVDRYDFNFLMEWAEKGIEAQEGQSK